MIIIIGRILFSCLYLFTDTVLYYKLFHQLLDTKVEVIKNEIVDRIEELDTPTTMFDDILIYNIIKENNNKKVLISTKQRYDFINVILGSYPSYIKVIVAETKEYTYIYLKKEVINTSDLYNILFLFLGIDTILSSRSFMNLLVLETIYEYNINKRWYIYDVIIFMMFLVNCIKSADFNLLLYVKLFLYILDD